MRCVGLQVKPPRSVEGRIQSHVQAPTPYTYPAAWSEPYALLLFSSFELQTTLWSQTKRHYDFAFSCTFVQLGFAAGYAMHFVLECSRAARGARLH